jgi:hypothetical protein
LIVVHPEKDWVEYGVLLNLGSPFLDSPFVFALSQGHEQDLTLSSSFPKRTIWHYYPSDPDRFYSTPR